MEDQKEYTEIKFKYIYKAEEGEDVRVVGNIEKLGNWDCELAFKLINSEKDKDIWISKTNMKIPINFDLEYKYILFKDGIFEKWEKLPYNKNRSINIPDIGKYILYDAEGDPTTCIEKNKIILKSAKSKKKQKINILNQQY